MAVVTLGSEGRSLKGLLRSTGVRADKPETIPFAFDATGGAQNEYQVAVQGTSDVVDLPRTIRQSNCFAIVVRRAVAGDTPRRAVTAFEAKLNDDPGIWESSWVRIPLRTLNPRSRRGSQLWRALAETVRIDYPATRNVDPLPALRLRHRRARRDRRLTPPRTPGDRQPDRRPRIPLEPAPAPDPGTPWAGGLLGHGAQHPDRFVARIRPPPGRP